MAKLGFLVNPIAGMGGRVGLKGTDGVVDAAKAAGAAPVAPDRALDFLQALHWIGGVKADWLTCAGEMGASELESAGFEHATLRYRPHDPSSAEDTRQVSKAFVQARADLILFCGGDGTARDVAEAVAGALPILGIPAGVKMHSAVFATTPAAGASIVASFLRGELRVGDGEILDVDEAAYRAGEWKVRIFATAKTLVEPNLVQMGKLSFTEVTGEGAKDELADHFRDLFEEEPDTLFLLGPGSTLEGIASRLGIEKSLLGIDAVVRGQTIRKDLDERGILRLLDDHPTAKLVVSPIGAQGFILGRGNLQVSPEVLRKVGLSNLVVVATTSKLAATPILRVDTGDSDLDVQLRAKRYLFVVIGYRTSKLHPIEG